MDKERKKVILKSAERDMQKFNKENYPPEFMSHKYLSVIKIKKWFKEKFGSLWWLWLLAIIFIISTFVKLLKNTLK